MTDVLSSGVSEMQAERIRRVASFADDYIKEHLSRWDSATLTTDWWQGLLFWFGHCFYQGRSDSVSHMFEQRAVGAIEKTLGTRSLSTLRSLANEDLTEGGALDNQLKLALVPKRMDRLMVLASLRLVSSLAEGNIVAHSLRRITEGNLEDHYDELMELPSVGPKIASFYLRDLDFLFDLSAYIPESGGYLAMQPIDMWVGRYAEQIGIISTSENTPGNRRRIVRACLQIGVDPNRFNVGAWWIGIHKISIP